VGVPKSLLPDLKKELNEMATRLFDLCEENNNNLEQVLQVQLQFFPLSKTKDT